MSCMQLERKEREEIFWEKMETVYIVLLNTCKKLYQRTK